MTLSNLSSSKEILALATQRQAVLLFRRRCGSCACWQQKAFCEEIQLTCVSYKNGQ